MLPRCCIRSATKGCEGQEVSEWRSFSEWRRMNCADAAVTCKLMRERSLLLCRIGADAMDCLGLAGNTDVGAHRRFTLGAARAAHALVGPPAAIRRPLLHRNVF